MNITLSKTLNNAWLPADPATAEWSKKYKPGQIVRGKDFAGVRNYKFLKKYFALLNIAFENWEPGEINSKYGVPEKNFDRFRSDCTILAGFYETYIRIDGTVRIEPKSISFSRMDNEEFSRLYNETITVLLNFVYKKKLSPEELNDIVEKYMEFA